MTIRKIFALTTLAAFATTAAVLATPQLSVGPGAPGSIATYHLHFAGTFWNGAAKAYDHDITLTATAAGANASILKAETHETATFAAKRNADGTLDPVHSTEPLSAYNTVVRLANGAPALVAGAQWDTSVPIPLIDGSNVDVPVHVHVASVTGDRVVVQATGSHGATMNYQGFTVPLDFTISLASAFNGGAFQRLDYTVEEVVHAGPETQTMHWTASLEAR